MKAVTGRTFEGKKATLSDWVRFRVLDSEYPGITSLPGEVVSGILYEEVDETLITNLDDFEGEKYERVLVDVKLEDGTIVSASTFAIKDDSKQYLSEEPWDFEDFIQSGLEKFINWFVEDRRDLYDRGDL